MENSLENFVVCFRLFDDFSAISYQNITCYSRHADKRTFIDIFFHDSTRCSIASQTGLRLHQTWSFDTADTADTLLLTFSRKINPRKKSLTCLKFMRIWNQRTSGFLKCWIKNSPESLKNHSKETQPTATAFTDINRYVVSQQQQQLNTLTIRVGVFSTFHGISYTKYTLEATSYKSFQHLFFFCS